MTFEPMTTIAEMRQTGDIPPPDNLDTIQQQLRDTLDRYQPDPKETAMPATHIVIPALEIDIITAARILTYRHSAGEAETITLDAALSTLRMHIADQIRHNPGTDTKKFISRLHQLHMGASDEYPAEYHPGGEIDAAMQRLATETGARDLPAVDYTEPAS